MGITSAEALRNRRAAQRNIRRRCKCGRIISGNPGWASHQRKHEGDPGHGYDGRA